MPSASMKIVLAALLLAALACPSGAAAQEEGERRQRVDIAEAPWRAIGQVNTQAYGRCTGVLIARQLAVTAAHCLFSRRTGRLLQPSSVHFVLGYDRGSYVFATRARTIHMDDAQAMATDGETLKRDWALLELAEPAPPSIEPIVVAPSPPAAGDFLSTAGFGRDRAYALTAVGDCLYRGGHEEGLMDLTCPVIAGYSGGPVIDRAGHLAGLVVAGSQRAEGEITIAIPATVWREAEADLQR